MMKRVISVFVLAVMLLAAFIVPSYGADQSQAKITVTLNVYNWGEYISDGSEGSLDVNKAFEEFFNENLSDKYGFKVKVNYSTYASNEDMYNKIKSGAVSYDVIIPSDYMIERMINENLLLPLNYDNIPNFANIYDKYKNVFYDPDNLYTVPYMVGLVGVIYNKSMVAEEDVKDKSWSLLWNEKYKGRILQFDNPRDALGTAMYYLGIDVNTEDKSLWDKAAEKLKEQKPLIQSYVMDEVFNKMQNGSAAVAPYYAGDFLTMYENEGEGNLEFYYPKEGTNIFIDAMCIPICVAHKDVAEEYINFMTSEEIAVANAEYIYYASPNKLVVENEEYIEYMEDIYEGAIDLLYPADGEYKCSYFRTLSNDMLRYEDQLWEELKINNKTDYTFHIITGVVVVGIIVAVVIVVMRKKKREKEY